MGTVDDDELKVCLLELCEMATLPDLAMSFDPKIWFNTESSEMADEEVNTSSLKFGRYLLSAAAWLGEMSLVVKLVGQGFDWHDDL